MSDSPSLGPASVPVNIVEWADFECPHCRHAAPILEKLVEQFPGQVRFMFKFYPLQAHAHAESAARAAVAAMNQGKFWQMHHALFEHQEALEPRDVELYAKQIGLDVAKFKADLDSEATADRVARDRKQGDALALSGTPTVYINGREYDLTKFDMADDLQDWVKLEIDLGTSKTPQGEAARLTASSRASDAGTGGARASNGKTP
jgi:protein-disulfide isomerase